MEEELSGAIIWLQTWNGKIKQGVEVRRNHRLKDIKKRLENAMGMGENFAGYFVYRKLKLHVFKLHLGS